MRTVNDIRNEFLKFFVGKGHEHVASSPLVPQNDPTLMFANSGMVQFKNVFTGVEKRPYTRATTAQKSVRAGGKHNDLDNVGYTARHATFFEMLGNFSFGDYFKEDAIAFAWELVTKNFGMDKDKLVVTVHTSDEEAAGIWKKVAGFHDSKIIRIPTNDNFWMMGDTGPCGPCSEIFIDRGDHIWGGPPGSPDEDGDRFLEFWNLVFMQFEQEPDGNGGYIRKPLPKPSIDTGMGLERMATILQGVDTIFDIDLLRSIIEHSAELTGVSPDGPQAPSHRVIADHLRCASFLLADGVMPSNEGRGYVLRRIMRRGMRHAHLLGAQEPLMYKLFPTLQSMMGEAYPELKRAEGLIVETLKNEETRFKKTLDRGLKMLDDETSSLAQGQKLSGDVAFKLYDTYGFPVDLTADALRAKDLEVDMPAFEAAMEKQKETARKSWAGSGDSGTSKLWFELFDKFGATEFLGYSKTSAEGKILAIIKDGKEVDALKSGEEGFIIVNQSPFYAESGGQVGDTGHIILPQDNVAAVAPDEIKTSRLTMSIIRPDDQKDVFKTLNYKNTAETISIFSWPMTDSQAFDWCERSEKGRAAGTDFQFVAHADNGDVIGCAGIHLSEKGSLSAEVGYWVCEEYQNQGYATEMLEAIKAYAFSYLNTEEIFATTLPDNDISAAVLRNCGFIWSDRKMIPSLDGKKYFKDIFKLVKGGFVRDTKKQVGKIFVHDVIMGAGQISVGESVQLKVDVTRRHEIESHHSVTHLLHEALRQTLGDHIAQKGSLQTEGRTRFDISQPNQITAEQLRAVEDQVNEQIRANTEVVTRVLPLDEAIESGARALFGEKYDDEVRVVSMGTPRTPGSNIPYSVELCGGTHVRRTGDIGAFKILSESAVSAGIRRIEAVVGKALMEHIHEKEAMVMDVMATLKAASSDIPARVKSLVEDKKKLEQEISSLRRQLATGGGGTSANDDVKDIGGVKFLAKVLPGFPAKDLKPMAEDMTRKLGSGVVALIATEDGKASVVVAVTKDLTAKINAVDLVKAAAEAMGGSGGGGRPDMAQAGGPNGNAANDALGTIEKRIAG